MESTYEKSALLTAAGKFNVVAPTAHSRARNAFVEALENALTTDADLPALFRDMTGSDKNQHTSPLDIAVEVTALKKDSLLESLLRNGGAVRRWPHTVYVPSDYPRNTLFPPPENLYMAELPTSLEKDPNKSGFSASSFHTGDLVSNAGSRLRIFHEKSTVRSGVFILYKATHDDVGRFGSAAFSPKVTWSTTANFRNIGALFSGTQNTATSIELTVDEFNRVTNTFEPLTGYESRQFPINSHEGFSEVTRRWEENSVFRTGELEHSFLAQVGTTYRLGVIARVDISHTVSDGSGLKLPTQFGPFGADFYSVLSATVSSITLNTRVFVP